MKLPKFKFLKLKHLKKSIKMCFWFLTGAFLSLFFISTSIFLIFEKINQDKVYPGVFINGVNFGGRQKQEVKDFFLKKNELIKDTQIVFFDEDKPAATASAKELEFGFNADLISTQAFSIGRSNNILTNIYLISLSYVKGVYLPASYRYSSDRLTQTLSLFSKGVDKEPIDALFKFENGRVATFRPSQEGKKVNFENLGKEIISKSEYIIFEKPKEIKVSIPIDILQPKVQTEDANNFGIKELIGEGRSLFAHSIPSRIFNITLASSRLNGVLVPPGETFSFDKTLGDISAFTGYQQAYIIKDGKTILGDGGGVCQVSTTLFRGLLNAGLPIVERNQHSYRVGYYEQDSLPGFDATIYVPSVDLKFKNDTGSYILIQTTVDPTIPSITFSLFGKKDGREVIISNPLVTNQVNPPPPAYQDDPSLAKGQIKQVDFEARGATVSFTRQVKKDGKVIISDKFVSNYRPWQAVYLRGTKE